MRVATSRIAAVVLSFALGAVVVSCGGGEKEVKSELSTTKVGQQLADLKQARDAGKITEDEYAKERARILKGN